MAPMEVGIENREYLKHTFSESLHEGFGKEFAIAECDIQKRVNYPCKEDNCSEKFCTLSLLQRHLKDYHNVDPVDTSKKKINSRAEVQSKKNHKCPFPQCNAQFIRPWRLSAHICTHTGEKPFKCSAEHCTKMYTTLVHLRRHVSEAHQPSNTEFICLEEECNKKYKSERALRQHQKKFHINKQKGNFYKCCDCELNFSNKKRLKTHQLTHKREPLFRCDECQVAFMDNSSWKKHIYHHNKNVFTCKVEDCNEKFNDFKIFCEHKKLKHSTSTMCTTCDRSFKTASALHVHMKTHLTKEHSRFLCTYDDCPRSYVKKSNLEQHILSYHRGIRLLCLHSECNKSFVTKQKLEEHMKLHDETRSVPERKRTSRKQRKDAGIPKKSMAVKLSGLKVSYDVEKIILKSSDVNEVYTNVAMEQ